MYKLENVSCGDDTTATLPNGASITFEKVTLTLVTRLDERNLLYCKYLNLHSAPIISLNPSYLRNLELLVLLFSSITKVNLVTCTKLTKVYSHSDN